MSSVAHTTCTASGRTKLQAIKNWTAARPGNEASACDCSYYTNFMNAVLEKDSCSGR